MDAVCFELSKQWFQRALRTALILDANGLSLCTVKFYFLDLINLPPEVSTALNV